MQRVITIGDLSDGSGDDTSYDSTSDGSDVAFGVDISSGSGDVSGDGSAGNAAGGFQATSGSPSGGSATDWLSQATSQIPSIPGVPGPSRSVYAALGWAAAAIVLGYAVVTYRREIGAYLP